MLMPQAGPHHDVAQSEFFVMPIELVTPSPLFPDAEKATHAPVVAVCAELWLSLDGDVTSVQPFHDTEECAAPVQDATRPYLKAVLAALKGWEFTPAVICTFAPEAIDKRARGDCTGDGVTLRRVPVRLNYAFVFTSANGKREVGVQRRP